MLISASAKVSRAWAWATGATAQISTVWLIMGPTIALTGLGVVLVLSASSVALIDGPGSFSSLTSQGVYAGLGVVMLVWMRRWKPRTVHKLAVVLLLISIGLLVLVVFTPLGVEVNGGRRWLHLGGMSFQPSEAAKLSLCVWAGYALHQKRKVHAYGKAVLVPVVVPFGGLIVLLVLLGKDIGTAVVILFILAVIVYLAGLPRVYLLATSAAGLAALVLLAMQSGNRMMRIQAWLGHCDHPADPCYQYEQGIFALASGSWFGLGLGQSRQKWSYIPEAGNDLILAILGEELGLAGTLLVVGLFITLGLGMFRVAYHTTNTFVFISTAAIMTWLLGQTVLNLAMVTGLLPIIGVPLPFISAGGSALLMSLLGVGVVLSFAQQQTQQPHNTIKHPEYVSS